MIKTYRFFPLLCLVILVASGYQDRVQVPSVQAIRDLKEGVLIVRFPGFKAKIDTLTSMISRTEDENTKNRLQKLLDETIYERDTVRQDYIQAFGNYYDFSKVAYFMDFEAKDPENANFFSLEGSKLTFQEITKGPHVYLFFEKSEESKIDALVVYDKDKKIIPRPFPNNFTRGGFSFLFTKLSEQKFADWRVKKMNKKFHKFWEQVN